MSLLHNFQAPYAGQYAYSNPAVNVAAVQANIQRSVDQAAALTKASLDLVKATKDAFPSVGPTY